MTPSERVKSKSNFKGLHRDLEQSLSNLGWKLSGPGDLLGFKLERAFSKSFIETLQVYNEFAISLLYSN